MSHSESKEFWRIYAGTPQPIIDKLKAWFAEIGGQDDVRAFLARNGGEPMVASPAQTKALIDKETADWEST